VLSCRTELLQHDSYQHQVSGGAGFAAKARVAWPVTFNNAGKVAHSVQATGVIVELRRAGSVDDEV
jgi:hypothetical protein